ncbi:MAG: hypothetical protein WBB34_10230 [Xanthobacteraceae bacterium]
MMMTTFTTIATAHPLIVVVVVLTVSHDSLFRQPLICSGTTAAASLFAVCRHLKFYLNTMPKNECPKTNAQKRFRQKRVWPRVTARSFPV